MTSVACLSEAGFRRQLGRRPAAVVFDMDGVLFDTERLYEEAAIAAATEFGIEMTSAFFRSTVGTPWPVNRQRLLDHFGPTLAVDDLGAAAGRIFQQLLEARRVLKPGVTELLGLLDELGLPRAIATSSPRHRVEDHLARHELSGRFHQIVAHGDYTNSKPDPEPFQKAAQALGVDAALCLAIEDSHAGVRAASAAGMITIMVPDLLPATDDIRSLCAHVASDLHEVAHLLSIEI
jgi:HAD superfamily hydrolase (TIGR01509 family)